MPRLVPVGSRSSGPSPPTGAPWAASPTLQTAPVGGAALRRGRMHAGPLLSCKPATGCCRVAALVCRRPRPHTRTQPTCIQPATCRRVAQRVLQRCRPQGGVQGLRADAAHPRQHHHGSAQQRGPNHHVGRGALRWPVGCGRAAPPPPTPLWRPPPSGCHRAWDLINEPVCRGCAPGGGMLESQENQGATPAAGRGPPLVRMRWRLQRARLRRLPLLLQAPLLPGCARWRHS